MAIPVQFMLANASVGKPYAQTPQLLTAYPYPVTVVDIDLERATGLHFDPASGQLTGQPLLAGEFQARLFYYLLINGERSPIKSVVTTVLINPDPRSLWKNIPSAPALYGKADAAARLLTTGLRTIIAASQRGRAHAHKGDSRDDDFYIAASGHWHIAIVADGAGSAKYSRQGSLLACQAAGEFLLRELAGEYGALIVKAAQAQTMPEVQVLCQTLLANAVGRAVQAIETEALSQPDADARDFATTLLIAITRPMIADGHDLYACYSVGDGVMALYQPAQSVTLLSVGDSGEFAGQTRFLTVDVLNEEELAQRCQIRLAPAGQCLLLMTDGVSDPFFDSDNQLQGVEAWDGLWQALQHGQALDNEHNLLAWLAFWSAGNHDDRTLVVLRQTS